MICNHWFGDASFKRREKGRGIGVGQDMKGEIVKVIINNQNKGLLECSVMQNNAFPGEKNISTVAFNLCY